MSIDYWPISGFGIKFDLSLFDPEKLLDMMGIKVTAPDGELLTKEEYMEKLYQIGIDAVLEKLVSTPEVEALGIGWGNTAEMDDGCYLMYYAWMPWEMPDPMKNLTMEQATENIVTVLLPYLRDGVTSNDLRKMVGDICTVGCG